MLRKSFGGSRGVGLEVEGHVALGNHKIDNWWAPTTLELKNYRKVGKI